jgi:hypothetical protein
VLVIFVCSPIPDLSYMDSAEALQLLSLNPSTTTYPDETYQPLNDAADTLRRVSRTGVVYASARHCRGLAVALFGDRSADIKVVAATLRIQLSLVAEDGQMLVADHNFDPTRMRISHRLGHFAIDASDFGNHQFNLDPRLNHPAGLVDFQRRFFPQAATYPDCAVRP